MMHESVTMYVTRKNRGRRRTMYAWEGKVFAHAHIPPRWMKHLGQAHGYNEISPKIVNSDGKIRMKNRRRNRHRQQAMILGDPHGTGS